MQIRTFLITQQMKGEKPRGCVRKRSFGCDVFDSQVIRHELVLGVVEIYDRDSRSGGSISQKCLWRAPCVTPETMETNSVGDSLSALQV